MQSFIGVLDLYTFDSASPVFLEGIKKDRMFLLFLSIADYSHLDIELTQHLRSVVVWQVVCVFLCRLEMVMQMLYDFMDRVTVLKLLRELKWKLI